MIRLVQTCSACPEQYDALLDGEQVGYLRLRSGVFTATCPGPSGDLVYRAAPRGDGCFESYERDYFLTRACEVVQQWVARRGRPGLGRVYVVDDAEPE